MHPSTTWANPKAVELLQDCLARRHTAAQTAKILSHKLGIKVSRNSVIGKARRSGLRIGAQTADEELQRKRTIRKRQEEAERKRVYRARIEAERDVAKRAELATMVEPKPCGDGERGCRFPSWGFDDRPNHIYCGAPCEFPSSYCTYHFRVCTQVVSERQANKIIETAAA